MKRWILRPILRVADTVLGLVTALVLVLAWPVILGLAARRRRLGRIRSLWTGAPIINMTVNAQAERSLGISATTLVYHTYFITSAFDINLSRWMHIRLVRLWLPYLVYVWACFRFDRFHTYFNYGMLPSIEPHQFRPLELWLNRILRKQHFVYTYGSDVRSRETTQALGPLNCCLECPAVGKACVCDEEARRTNVGRVMRYATQTFAMGDMTEYVPGGHHHLFFWPVEIEKYEPAIPQKQKGERVLVVHAPNHREFKGTRYLIAAVEKLQAEGVPVDLRLVERMSHEEAMDVYRQADIIADQFLIGFHGYFAIEGMALGKPVLCYIRKPEYLLHPEECPMVNAPATELASVLRRLLEDPAQLTGLGRQGRAYVERHHPLPAFAQRLRQAYQDCGVME